MSIYELKPRFQALLRPAVRWLDRLGVTANQVTIAACLISVAIGLGLCATAADGLWLLAIPIWMLLRMAFNAIDGMLAREFGHKSALGAYLNELTDVVSDAALYLPFAFLTPFTPTAVALVIFLSLLTEMTGVVAVMTGASRRYDGPMGKSDRAFVFGLLAIWLAVGPPLPEWAAMLMWLIAALCALTTVNRVRKGLAELKAAS